MKKLMLVAFAMMAMLMLTGCEQVEEGRSEYPRVRIDPSPTGSYIKFSLYNPKLHFTGYDVSEDGLTVTMHFKEE